MFLGVAQGVYGVRIKCFRGSREEFLESLHVSGYRHNEFGGGHNEFPGCLRLFSGDSREGLQGMRNKIAGLSGLTTSHFRCVCDWCSGLCVAGF